jgi:hypothetical protein
MHTDAGAGAQNQAIQSLGDVSQVFLARRRAERRNFNPLGIAGARSTQRGRFIENNPRVQAGQAIKGHSLLASQLWRRRQNFRWRHAGAQYFGYVPSLKAQPPHIIRVKPDQAAAGILGGSLDHSETEFL